MHVPSSAASRSSAYEEVALTVEEGATSLANHLCPELLGTRMTSEERHLASLRRYVVDGLKQAILRGRVNPKVDAPIFRKMGEFLSREGIPLERQTAAADAAAEAVRDELVIPAARAVESEFTTPAVEAAITHHCKVIDDFAREVYRQLLASHAAHELNHSA